MSEFEVLERLACDCGERPRMQELSSPSTSARARSHARSAGSRRTAWSSRTMCPEDRRGIAVCLTAEGRERYEAARPTHRRVLAESLTPPA